MKRKVMIALIATLALTVGSLGAVSAHEHSWGDAYYVVDQEATEDSKEWVVDKPAEYEQVWVVDKPAEYEQNWVVDKPAEYEQIKVVDKEAWTEEIKETHTICYACESHGITTIMDGWSEDQIISHGRENHGGPFSYGSREIVVDTIYHPEEFHYEQGALISPEQGHWEQGALISPEQGHYENGDLISLRRDIGRLSWSAGAGSLGA